MGGARRLAPSLLLAWAGALAPGGSRGPAVGDGPSLHRTLGRGWLRYTPPVAGSTTNRFLHNLKLRSTSSHLQSGAMSGGAVTISYFNGRLGNNINQLGAALTFARSRGARKLKIPKRVGRGWKGQIHTMFDLPDEIELPGIVDVSLQKNCNMVPEVVPNWWKQKCELVPARIYHEELLRYIRPRMKAELAACVEAPETEWERGLLTVHLRGEDTPDYSYPCSMISKIRAEGGYKRLLVVTHPDHKHACVPQFEALARRDGANVRVQSGSLLEDTCALVRARDLVLSFSTFPESAALISNRTRRIYHTGDFEPFWDLKGTDWCTSSGGEVWPGTTLVQYNLSSYADMSAKERVTAIHNYPMERISRQENVVCS